MIATPVVIGGDTFEPQHTMVSITAQTSRESTLRSTRWLSILVEEGALFAAVRVAEQVDSCQMCGGDDV